MPLPSADNVDALLATLPTAEEIALVQAEDGPGVVWDRPEQLVLAVGAVEQAEARLKCWQLRGTFQERLDSVGREGRDRENPPGPWPWRRVAGGKGA